MRIAIGVEHKELPRYSPGGSGSIEYTLVFGSGDATKEITLNEAQLRVVRLLINGALPTYEAEPRMQAGMFDANA